MRYSSISNAIRTDILRILTAAAGTVVTPDSVPRASIIGGAKQYIEVHKTGRCSSYYGGVFRAEATSVHYCIMPIVSYVWRVHTRYRRRYVGYPSQCPILLEHKARTDGVRDTRALAPLLVVKKAHAECSCAGRELSGGIVQRTASDGKYMAGIVSDSGT